MQTFSPLRQWVIYSEAKLNMHTFGACRLWCFFPSIKLHFYSLTSDTLEAAEFTDLAPISFQKLQGKEEQSYSVVALKSHIVFIGALNRLLHVRVNFE